MDVGTKNPGSFDWLENDTTEETKTEKIEAELSRTYKECEKLDREINREDYARLYDLFNTRGRENSTPLTQDDPGLFKKITEHITEQCGVFKPYQIFSSTPIIQKPLKNSDNTLRAGQYSPSDDEISINSVLVDRTTYPEIFLTLVGWGEVSLFTVVHHEYIHSFQSDVQGEIERLNQTIVSELGFAKTLSTIAMDLLLPLFPWLTALTLKDIGDQGTILHEIHAFVGAFRTANTRLTDIQNLKDKLWGTDSAYRIKKGDASKLQFYMAYDDIRRLYSLGCSDQEIGALVKDAKWDDERRCYDTLEARVQSRTKELGLTESNVDNLVSLDELRRMLYIKTVKKIAQKDIISALSK